jgi:protein-tyrosine phosphatase
MLDMSWITTRLAVGGGLWTELALQAVERAGITHIINTQAEFDDRILLHPSRPPDCQPEIFWLGTDDDLEPKPPSYFHPGIRFALEVLSRPETKLLVHCASGIHRGPLLALAILRVLGFDRHDALRLLRTRRPQADFPEVYLDSVEAFLAEWEMRSADSVG